MRLIDINECQQILLDIAKAVDSICRQNHIPYYLLGGSMLGAIRHKGFIPWDDDMDIGIPRSYYEKFLEIANKTLPLHYKVLTYKNDKRIVFGVSKIQDVRTLIDDPRSRHPLDQQLGINVDIFPLDYCGKLGVKYYSSRVLIRLQRLLFVESTRPNIFKTLSRKVLRALFSVRQSYLPEVVDKIIVGFSNKNSFMGSFWSGYKAKHIMPSDVWGEPTEYKFEDAYFLGVYDYDSYLTTLMGNYMQLPSINKRIAHCSNIYFR